MALPMLVNGTECGPSNPLQGLSKRFDQDRGLQQDHFSSGRAGPSRETFRSQQSHTPGLDQDAARFFSANSSAAPQLTTPSAYDLSALHASLPSPQLHAPVQSPQLQQPNPLAAWASDFMQQQPMQSQVSHITNTKGDTRGQQENMQQRSMAVMPQGGMQWNPAFSGYRMSPMSNFAPGIPIQAQKPATQTDQSLWDKEFQSQEVLASTVQVPLQEIQQNQQIRQQGPQDSDDLARTAGLLLETVQGEQNPKFQNSEFLGLMKQLRDRMVVVEGNQMVPNDGAALATGWNNEFQADVKGKGRAVDHPVSGVEQLNTRGAYRPLPLNNGDNVMEGIGRSNSSSSAQDSTMHQEDTNDAYFRQENEDYARYWNEVHIESAPQGIATSQSTHWDQLQSDWDQFEATSAGIKKIDNYQFQSNNPYLLGDSSRTHHHMTHGQQSFYESVLELEAAVQRDTNNAAAWFELGVKQQENEREQKAIQALHRAVDLDPSHLPTWLALAISYTNDSNRLGTYNAIKEWVDRNGKYETAVRQHRAQNPETPNAATTERFGHLIQCLIAMARSDASGEVDADIQIALAVLLNTNEDYDKAQDCFRTALAVRPDDWLLYNRVGATMANSGHAEEALQYYYRALELNPVYIRARFNLGISCINLRRYEEAAQHILDALALQDSDGVRDSTGLNEKRGVTSTALWDSLKTTCLHMQRVDLATLCDRQDLDGFRSNFQI